jgi:hypothetical protein
MVDHLELAMIEYEPHHHYARRLTPQVIELLSPMTLDPLAVAWILRDAHELGHAEDWFLDATMVTTMSTETIPTIMRAVNYAKDNDGLKRFVIVLPSPFIRLALQSEAERAPVLTIVVEFRDEGLTVLGL